MNARKHVIPRYKVVYKCIWGDEEGPWLLEASNGDHIFVSHGSQEGWLWQGEKPPADTWVICCYPVQVQEKHPHLKVIGDWKTRTRYQFKHEENALYLWEEIVP